MVLIVPYFLAGIAACGAFHNLPAVVRVTLWFLFPVHLAVFRWVEAVKRESHSGLLHNKPLWWVLGVVLWLVLISR